MNEENKIKHIIDSLSKSKFRGTFHLNKKMKDYVNEKGTKEIERHAYDFINQRIKPAIILNDGKQTPMKQVHPVFIAQHACGFCCRSCMQRIHKIPKSKELTKEEINYIVNFIMIWIKKEIEK